MYTVCLYNCVNPHPIVEPILERVRLSSQWNSWVVNPNLRSSWRGTAISRLYATAGMPATGPHAFKAGHLRTYALGKSKRDKKALAWLSWLWKWYAATVEYISLCSPSCQLSAKLHKTRDKHKNRYVQRYFSPINMCMQQSGQAMLWLLAYTPTRYTSTRPTCWNKQNSGVAVPGSVTVKAAFLAETPGQC